jgi:hypothetical protein
MVLLFASLFLRLDHCDHSASFNITDTALRLSAFVRSVWLAGEVYRAAKA